MLCRASAYIYLAHILRCLVVLSLLMMVFTDDLVIVMTLRFCVRNLRMMLTRVQFWVLFEFRVRVTCTLFRSCWRSRSSRLVYCMLIGEQG